jgi:hypothetical protein
MNLRQTADEQVDIVDVAVDGLKGLLQYRIRGQLREGIVWFKPNRPPRLIERAEPYVPLALYVNGDEINFVYAAATT